MLFTIQLLCIRVGLAEKRKKVTSDQTVLCLMKGHDLQFEELHVPEAIGCRFMVLILLFVPSSGPVEMGKS